MCEIIRGEMCVERNVGHSKVVPTLPNNIFSFRNNFQILS